MSRISWTSWIGATLFLLGVLLWLETFSEDYQLSVATSGRGPVFYPRILLTGILLLAAIIFLQELRERRVALDRRASAMVLAVIGLTAVYIYAIELTGFLLASIAYTLLLPILLGYRRPLVNIAVAVVFSWTAWYLFEKVFLIILPSSPWFDRF